MIGSIGEYYGMKIIVKPPLQVKIKRTWKERLFSLPWRPWTPHYFKIKESIKNGQVIKTPNSIIMNQVTYGAFKEALKHPNQYGRV